MTSSRRRRPAPLAIAASLLLASSPALAQPSVEADALIERGIQLREKGHDDQALVEFRHAYALSPSPRARAQMALAEQAVGSWVLADQHLHEALAAESDAWISGRRAILTTAAAAIAHHLGTLIVTGQAQPGARVSLDGVDVGPLPLERPVRLETGSRLLEVRAPGFYPIVRTLDIAPGATARETVTLVVAPSGEAAVAPAASPAVEEKLTEGGAPGHGAFHAAFYPGGPPSGVWTLRDERDAVLCNLPCAYWLDGAKQYALVRASLVKDDSDLRLTPPTGFTEGAYVREQIKGPTGSRVAGVALLVGGLALVTVGAVVYATETGSINNESGYELDYLGVIAMVAGGFATAGGVATLALSTGWRVDAQARSAPTATLRLEGRGLGLALGPVAAWVTPLGAHGSF